MQPQNEFTTGFRGALAGQGVPQGVTARLPAEAAIRFAVYRNNVAHSLKQALGRRFPVVERLVGAEFFAAMAAEFIVAHPPRSPVLAEWGGDFAGWLAAFPPVAGLRYLPDVARIEWARGRAYHAADAMPAAPQDLSPDATLRLHPSLQLLRLTHPAVSIWAANQPGRDGRCAARGPEIALIFRRPDFEVPVQPMTEADAAMLDALMAGRTLAEAVGTHDPSRLLALLLTHSLICKDEDHDHH